VKPDPLITHLELVCSHLTAEFKTRVHAECTHPPLPPRDATQTDLSSALRSLCPNDWPLSLALTQELMNGSERPGNRPLNPRWVELSYICNHTQRQRKDTAGARRGSAATTLPLHNLIYTWCFLYEVTLTWTNPLRVTRNTPRWSGSGRGPTRRASRPISSGGTFKSIKSAFMSRPRFIGHAMLLKLCPMGGAALIGWWTFWKLRICQFRRRHLGIRPSPCCSFLQPMNGSYCVWTVEEWRSNLSITISPP